MSKAGFLRKITSAVLAISLVLVLPFSFCGCSSDYSNFDSHIVIRDVEDSKESNDVLLTFFGYKADSANLLAIEDILSGFMDMNSDINVAYEGAKGTTYWEVLYKRADTLNLDDVFMVNTESLTSFSKRGLLADLSDINNLDHYSEIALTQCTTDSGNIYCLPMCISTYNLFINYDLLNQYGQKIPENWNEFQEVCDFFVNEGITPIVANNYQSLSSLIVAYSFYPIYQQDNYEDVLERLEQNPSECVKTVRSGVERASEMIERGWFDSEEVLATAQTSDDLELFETGERPFMITGGWASSRVEAASPELNFGVYPYPILDSGSVLVTDVNTCISVNAGGENVEESKRLVDYLTNVDAIDSYCESQSSFSPLKEGHKPSDQRLQPSFEYMNNGQSVIGSNYKMTFAMDATYIRDCCNMLFEGAGADDVCDALLQALIENKKN